MKTTKTSTFIVILLILLGSANSCQNKSPSIFGVYDSYSGERFYLYPDSTFLELRVKTRTYHTESDGPKVINEYTTKDPYGYGTFTILKEENQNILKISYKKQGPINFGGGRFKLVNDNKTFYYTNLMWEKRTFNKIGGESMLLEK
ncbi:hypothetical protein [Aequorivita sp. KMM 9714]|uniref:hypothetical protein n=1 Tax=Aequorivita sp. KMM 9714 TaxID=2707173 RepID=UPI0013EA5316|nr:hypothetical protein [Aequorivita sp. KMM 9714]NGX85146.1 hypothetical protein [Aequorivita sp. KMM 9714]